MKYVSWALVFIVLSCDIRKSDVEPDDSFVRVYESANIDEKYYPVDIIQPEEDYYLVLSALIDSSLTNFPKIHLLALNLGGEVLATLTLPDNYVNPVKGWLSVGGNNYFVCMDDITLQSKLVQVMLNNNDELRVTETMSFDRKMPLHAWYGEDAMILLSYDRIGRYTIIDRYDNNFNPQWWTAVNTNEDFESAIWAHFQKTGKEFPFFAGAAGPKGDKDFFVNCLANYSMALLFIEGQSGGETGRIYAYQDETGITSALSLQNDTFAISRYHSGDCYVYPKVYIDRNILQNTIDFQDILISLLQDDAHTDIIKYNSDGKDYIVFASTSRANQILLLFFDAVSGEQVYVHTLGYGNPVEITIMILTKDNGLAILGKTWINGQYQRIIFYKVSENQLELEE